MEKYIGKFIRYLEIEKNYSQHTILNYHLDLKDFLKFLGSSPIEKADYLKLRKYLALLKEKSLSVRSINRRLSCLRSFFKFLTREGYLKSNPMLVLSSPRLQKHLPEFLTEAEVFKLIDSVLINDKPEERVLRDKAILETFYSTGMRIFELVSLNIDDVDSLKRSYFLLEIKDYLLMKRLTAKCGIRPTFVLYFYSNNNDNCDDCEKMGYVLTALRDKYPDLRVYSFDYDFGVEAIKTLVSIYKVEPELPAMIINGEPFYGLRTVEELEKEVPALKLLKTASSTESTSEE